MNRYQVIDADDPSIDVWTTDRVMATNVYEREEKKDHAVALVEVDEGGKRLEIRRSDAWKELMRT